MLNTERLVDTGDGWVTEAGSEHVVHILEDGKMVEVGPGRAIAASPTTILRLICPANNSGCDLHRNNELVLSDPDGTDQRTVRRSFDGTWMPVGGPSIPSDAMSLQTVSPDGSRLLIILGKDLDVNGLPARSELLIVDIDDGTTRVMAEFRGRTPLATWSHDGQWMAILEGNDIRLINVTNPETVITLARVIPQDHFPLAAG